MGSIQIVETVSDKAGSINEDYVGYNNKAAWILDGATALGENHFLDGKSDASFYVSHFSNELDDRIADIEIPLREVFRSTIAKISDSFKEKFNYAKIKPYELPSASMAVVRINGTRLECATLGDCKILVSYDGEVKRFSQSTKLELLDLEVIQKIKKIQIDGEIDFANVRAKIKNDLQTNRALMNRSNGYWVLGFDPRAADYIDCIELDSSVVGDILLISDGFLHLVDTFAKFSDEELLCQVVEKGVENVKSILRELEKDDKNCVKYPRLKPSDDASAILLRLKS